MFSFKNKIEIKHFGQRVHDAAFPLAADVAPMIKFLKEIEEGTIVIMAAFDDPATKYFYRRRLLRILFPRVHPHTPLFRRLNEEARKLISDLGSSVISTLGFRDSWIFVGGKGIKTKTPFEQVTRAVTRVMKLTLCARALAIKC